MLIIDKGEKADFAEAIVNAAGLINSIEGGEFIDKFQYEDGIKMTDAGRKKIIDWIKYSNGAKSATRDKIKHYHNNPKEIYNFLVEEVHPPLN
jgi:hypothetical protein